MTATERASARADLLVYLRDLAGKTSTAIENAHTEAEAEAAFATGKRIMAWLEMLGGLIV